MFKDNRFAVDIGIVTNFDPQKNYQKRMELQQKYKIITQLEFEEFQKRMQYEYENWNLLFDNYQDIVLNITNNLGNRVLIPQKNGLIKKFVDLQSPLDITIFAQTYGMLGLSLIPHRIEYAPHHNIEKLFNEKGMTVFTTTQILYHEPLNLWYFFIDHAKKVFRLYQELVKANTDEDYIITSVFPVRTDTFELSEFEFRWHDGKRTNYYTWFDEPKLDNELIRMAAREILMQQILLVIEHDDIVPTTILDNKNSPIGFSIMAIEGRSSVLRHMYYELWELLTSDGEIKVCENPNCLLPNKNKRKRYCDDACKQEAYRLRKEKEVKEYERLSRKTRH